MECSQLSDYPKLLTGLKDCSEAERQHHLRHLARTDLYFLLRYILNRKDIEREWLFQRCIEVQQSPDGYLDLWAREHYKSTIITFARSIQDIIASHGDEPLSPRECTIGLFSHTRPSAKGFLRQIKQELELNEVLKELFPDIFYKSPSKQSPKWSEDEGICVKRKTNPKEQTVEAWGLVDGQPTGKHFTTLVYDDIVTKESVTTPDMIRKTTEALELSYNLGTDGGVRRFIGTRYHFNDSYKTIIDRGSVIPRLYAATKDGLPDGEPVLIEATRLQEKRRDMGSYTFACQMLQNPVADEAQGLKEEWLRYYDDVNLSRLNLYLLFDPANDKKKTSDYTCGWVLGLGGDRKIRVIDCVRDRLNLKERADLVFRWHRKYKPIRNGVRYEQYGMQADIQYMRERMGHESYDFEITEVGGSTPKNDRIRRLIPYFESGRILMPRSLHYTNYEKKTVDLMRVFVEEEYKCFPTSVHDDMLDCLARILEPDLEMLWPMEIIEQLDIMPNYFSNGEGWMG